MAKTVTFHGSEYLLIGDMESGGAIATREQFSNGECSFAHLGKDGMIRRFHEVIGTKADLTITGESDDPPVALGSFVNMFTHPSWGGR